MPGKGRKKKAPSESSDGIVGRYIKKEPSAIIPRSEHCLILFITEKTLRLIT